eukprot:2986875-Pleurochrysis_carterae.AAC.1
MRRRRHLEQAQRLGLLRTQRLQLPFPLRRHCGRLARCLLLRLRTSEVSRRGRTLTRETHCLHVLHPPAEALSFRLEAFQLGKIQPRALFPFKGSALLRRKHQCFLQRRQLCAHAHHLGRQRLTHCVKLCVQSGKVSGAKLSTRSARLIRVLKQRRALTLDAGVLPQRAQL